MKATGRLFQQISADTKDLDDLPCYWVQAQRHRLLEDEFFEIESFSSRSDFLVEASLYQNLLQPGLPQLP